MIRDLAALLKLFAGWIAFFAVVAVLVWQSTPAIDDVLDFISR